MVDGWETITFPNPQRVTTMANTEVLSRVKDEKEKRAIRNDHVHLRLRHWGFEQAFEMTP